MSEAHVYCQKRDLYGSDSDGSFFVPACPPNALYWTFEETRFVNNGSCLRFFGSWRLGCCLNRTSSQKPVYISKKRGLSWVRWLTGVPENVIDKWAFETRFVATRGIVSAFSNRTTPACSWPWLLRDIPLVRLREWNSELDFRLIVGRSSVQSGIPSLVWFLVSVSVPLFKSISMSGFPSRLSCPVQSVVLLSEAKANPLYCIRSSWLGWYIKHIGILLVWCVLKVIADGLSRGKKPEEMEKLVSNIWKATMRHPEASEIVNKDIISHFVLRLEELRKWFISMETALFQYRCRLESAEAQVGSAYYAALSSPFLSDSDPLLELQRSLMSEFDLPYKAVSHAEFQMVSLSLLPYQYIMPKPLESQLSQFLLIISTHFPPQSMKDKLGQVARSIGQPLPAADAIVYKIAISSLVHYFYLALFMLSPTPMKVPFEEVPELVAGRKVFVHRGHAYVAMNQVVSLVSAQFRSHLSKALVLTNRKWTSIIREQEKDRLTPIVEALCTSYLGPDYSEPREFAEISIKDIDQISKSSFPLCMRHLFEKLREDHHLKHGGRMQLGLFLKGVGLKLDDALAFWKAEFSQKVGAERFDKEYAYSIRHNYGREGKRTDYTPFSCQKIISSAPGVGDHHGCPYRHFSEENLRAALGKMRLNNRAVEDVMEKVRSRHYQIACTLTFEAIHETSCDAGINHPNQYFSDSQKVLQSKNHPTE
ncbi:putative DNA primase large subunit [Morella rubra]|uniref:Putative DNA primase large subunit n=1 Tax=Morella rubra TaxID=262757 RepID=A0A6A1ULD0_9ROSI|nr:putative DNA primase large subunit [Morella rubra]